MTAIDPRLVPLHERRKLARVERLSSTAVGSHPKMRAAAELLGRNDNLSAEEAERILLDLAACAGITALDVEMAQPQNRTSVPFAPTQAAQSPATSEMAGLVDMLNRQDAASRQQSGAPQSGDGTIMSHMIDYLNARDHARR